RRQASVPHLLGKKCYLYAPQVVDQHSPPDQPLDSMSEFIDEAATSAPRRGEVGMCARRVHIPGEGGRISECWPPSPQPSPQGGEGVRASRVAPLRVNFIETHPRRTSLSK